MFGRHKHWYVFYVGRLEAWLPRLIAITPHPVWSFAPVGRQAITFSMPDAIHNWRNFAPVGPQPARCVDAIAHDGNTRSCVDSVVGDARSSVAKYQRFEQVPVTGFPPACTSFCSGMSKSL
jgi:hypothetical protein